MRLGRTTTLAGAAVAAVISLVLAVVLVTPAGAATWPSVGQGASGANVTTVQYLLRHHGHTVGVDGSFGPATQSTVVSFQSARGLAADGVVGPQTWPHLVVEVREGASGDAVRAAQTQLNRYGAGLTVDGAFGARTTAAARAFQSAHGLAADGVVGPQTWQTLVSGGGGGDPSGYSLPLDRGALPRAAYAASHWNSTPAVDLIIDTVPAYAVTSGVVDHYDSASCGTGIRLLQPDGSRIVYCHLSARSTGDGVQVAAGARVATTGDTGNSGAPHLHVEIRTSDGVARCPQQYLLAIYDGQQPPSLGSLPTSGCTG